MSESKTTNTTPELTQSRVATKIKSKTTKAIEKGNQSLKTLKIEYVPVNSIIPNEYNPNRQSDHDFELLLKSIEEDGFTQPIVCVRREDGNLKIVDGEHRWRAGSTLGMTEVPVVITPMTEAQAKIATLRHNRARGSEDLELTANLIKDLEQLGALDWAQDSLQLDTKELEMMLEDVDVPDTLADDEFGDSWEPTQARATDIEASTPQAVEIQRKREEMLRQAKTQEERTMIEKDTKMFKVYLTFTGEEATVVKEVLGNSPAQNLLAICKKEKGIE